MGLDTRDTNYAESGVFIVRSSYGDCIVDTKDGTVLRVEGAETDENGWSNERIMRFDLETLVPIALSDGSVHDEIDILRTRFWFHTKEGHVRRVDPVSPSPKEED